MTQRRSHGVGGMSSAVSTGAFLTTVCLAHLVLGAGPGREPAAAGEAVAGTE